ncbi:MAG: DUF2452 domain-containing protein [Bacteroidota bacterium]
MSEQEPKRYQLSDIEFEKQKEKITENPGLIAYPHHVGSAAIKPEDQGKIKGKAVAAMHDQTTRQMQQLYDQMQTLAQQAQALKKRVEISERIYLSHITFEPVIGKGYFLYQRKDGTDTLSMIGPDEWGKSFPFEAFLAKVQLLSDHTWEVLDGEEASFS